MKYQVHQTTTYEGVQCDILTDGVYKTYTDINEAYRRIENVLSYWLHDKVHKYSFEVREAK